MDIPQVKDRDSLDEVNSKTKSTKNQRENSLKVAAAVSISGAYGSLSAEAYYAEGDKHKNSNEEQDFENNMTWEATGGDTTLCNDPPKWCGTVGKFYNWRIVEHDDTVPLSRLISSFKGFENVEDQFERAGEFADEVEVSKHVYTKVKLIGTKTSKPLVASLNSNHWISKSQSGISPSFGTSTKELFEQVGTGGVLIPSKDEEVSRSTWILERWVEPGENPKHPYGAKTYLVNSSMLRHAKYLGVTGSISRADGSGFLYPASESERAWFTFQTSPDKPPKRGPLEAGDIVEIRVRDKGDSADLGILRKCSYETRFLQQSQAERDGVLRKIQQVPGAALRKTAEESWQGRGTRGDENFLKFKVEILSASDTPLRS
ncbi:hypothetical protein SI65_00967 [Aspergillus cristatus]|uniref:Uncharacterized protein n=1 Tax=Aspergillus cristatus TaxID=573508 RepID=A0A1E3BR16_ASPCR|nr:hypothetical protein SI65_00967 [Aspergillus cristatus]